jgi:hypothetical protein
MLPIRTYTTEPSGLAKQRNAEHNSSCNPKEIFHRRSPCLLLRSKVKGRVPESPQEAIWGNSCLRVSTMRGRNLSPVGIGDQAMRRKPSRPIRKSLAPRLLA